MNENTIIENSSNLMGKRTDGKNQSGSWKQVTLGGISGILMGAGLMHAGQASASELESEESIETQSDSQADEQDVQVAKVGDDLSFGEAFAAARAEVGPGGVFYWHGGIYNTFTEAEWNGMTAEQKTEFAQHVQPEVQAHEVPTPTDSHPYVEAHHVEVQPAAQDADVTVVHNPTPQQIMDSRFAVNDVHIVGYGEAEGHLVVGYDLDDDGVADVAVIDVDDSLDLSDQDIVMDREGHVETLGEPSSDAVDASQNAAIDNPDVAPDMPDYMNDAVYDV